MTSQHRQWFFAAISTCFWFLLLVAIGSEHATFDRKWHDNVSNTSSAALFWHKTWQMHVIPVEQYGPPVPESEVPKRFLTDVADKWFIVPEFGPEQPVFFTGTTVPRPYPPGAWLVFAPAALMVYALGMTMKSAMFVTAFILLVIGHVSFIMFWRFLVALRDRHFRGHRWTLALWWLAIITLYLEFMRWSCNGEYDLAGMPPLVLAFERFQKKQYVSCVFWFAISLFLTLRTLLCLGILLISLFEIMRRRSQDPESFWKLSNWKTLFPAAVLGLTASAVFVTNAHFISTFYKLNEFHYASLGERSWIQLILFWAIFAGLCVWGWRRRLWKILSVFWSFSFELFITPLIRSWYVLYLFPIFLLIEPDEKRPKSTFALAFLCYCFGAIPFCGQSPLEFTFLQELWALL